MFSIYSVEFFSGQYTLQSLLFISEKYRSGFIIDSNSSLFVAFRLLLSTQENQIQDIIA